MVIVLVIFCFVLFVCYLLALIGWVVSIDMTSDAGEDIRHIVSFNTFYRLFKQAEKDGLFVFDNLFRDSIFSKEYCRIYFHADIFVINHEEYYFITPLNYALAKLLIRRTCKRHFASKKKYKVSVF